MRSAFDEAETVDVRIDLFDKPRIGFNEIYRDDKPFGDPFAAATVRLRKRNERWTSEAATGFGGILTPLPLSAIENPRVDTLSLSLRGLALANTLTKKPVAIKGAFSSRNSPPVEVGVPRGLPAAVERIYGSQDMR